MADIELVIKIPEKDFEFIKQSEGARYSRTIIEAITNGTPLPKGHGKLIDINPIMKYLFRPYSNEESYTNIDLERIFRNTPTIIEADKESEG